MISVTDLKKCLTNVRVISCLVSSACPHLKNLPDVLGPFRWKFTEVMYPKQLPSHSEWHSFAGIISDSGLWVCSHCSSCKNTNHDSWESGLVEEGY